MALLFYVLHRGIMHCIRQMSNPGSQKNYKHRIGGYHDMLVQSDSVILIWGLTIRPPVLQLYKSKKNILLNETSNMHMNVIHIKHVNVNK